MAYQDCLITTDGKLTDISIEDNSVVDVYPLVTLMNDKNTLIVAPLKIGKTRFCILKNNKEIVMFKVDVMSDRTIIDEVKGFEILTIDKPFEDELTLDEPPTLK